MVLQRTSGSCEGGNAEKMEDGLGAAHREDFPLGCDGGARDSTTISAVLPVPDKVIIVR